MPDEYILIRQIQTLFGLGAKPFFWLFNTLWGLGIGYLLPAIIFWTGDRKVGFRAGLFTSLSGIAGSYAKWYIAEPRPFYVSDAFTPLKVSTGFGMPSGNAQGYATLMVTIAAYLRRNWLWGLAGFMIFFGGLARVYYGVHSPSQVLWGWGAGIAIAVVLLRVAEPLVSWFRDKSVMLQLAILTGFSAGVMLVGVAIEQIVLQNFVVPESWQARYNEIAIATDEEDPFSIYDPGDSYIIGGYLLGFGIAGMLLLRGLVPEVTSKLGKGLNVLLGLTLLFTVRELTGILAAPFRGTILFWPYYMIAIGCSPLLIYALTPWLSARILQKLKPDALA